MLNFFSNSIRKFHTFPLLCALAFGTAQRSEAQSSAVYYTHLVAPDGFQLARINADGSGDQTLNAALAVATFPAWTKDGSIMTVTAVNPQRPSKVSQDVFAYNPANGAVSLVVPFEDLVTVEPVFSGGIKVGEQNRFSYTVPLYKGVSPDHSRIAVASLVTSGVYQTAQPPALDQLSGTTQTPLLQIYDAANGVPQEIMSLGRVRSFYTLGGFGVDWHPTQNVLVAAIDVDSPTVGSLSPSESSALFLIEAVPDAIQLGKVRQLTHPQGLLQIGQALTTASLQSDYAPAFSPDGNTVAYLRAINTIDSTGFVTQHRPISVSIRPLI